MIMKSRVFTSTVDWTCDPTFSFNTGYNYNWVNSDAVVDYFFNSVRALSLVAACTT